MVKKISKMVFIKSKVAKIQMNLVEAARSRIEDVAADFKADELGVTAKKILSGLDKLGKHIEDKNFGIAESTIEASIKLLRSTKKRIFNDAIENLENSIKGDEDLGIEKSSKKAGKEVKAGSVNQEIVIGTSTIKLLSDEFKKLNKLVSDMEEAENILDVQKREDEKSEIEIKIDDILEEVEFRSKSLLKRINEISKKLEIR